MSNISPEGNEPTLVLDGIVASSQLNTLVLNLTHVVLICRETRCIRKTYVVHQVDGLLVIVVELKRETLLKELCLNTEVVLVGLLPCQVLVAQCLEHSTVTRSIPLVEERIVNSLSSIVGEVDLTRTSIRTAKLQLVDILIALQEVIVVDVDTGTCREERSPTLIGTEL